MSLSILPVQVFILDSLANYETKDPKDAEKIVERVLPRLQVGGWGREQGFEQMLRRSRGVGWVGRRLTESKIWGKTGSGLRGVEGPYRGFRVESLGGGGQVGCMDGIYALDGVHVLVDGGRGNERGRSAVKDAATLASGYRGEVW